MNPETVMEAAPLPEGVRPSFDYHVTALEMPIYFNREGDHDHNGLIFALTKNVPILEYIRFLAEGRNPGPPTNEVVKRAQEIGVDLPRTRTGAQKPHPLIRPLVLRARKGNAIAVKLRNEVRGREVGLHLTTPATAPKAASKEAS